MVAVAVAMAMTVASTSTSTSTVVCAVRMTVRVTPPPLAAARVTPGSLVGVWPLLEGGLGFVAVLGRVAHRFISIHFADA